MTPTTDSLTAESMTAESMTAEPLVAPNAIGADVRRGLPGPIRFVIPFVIGLLAAIAIGAGALYAYDAQYAGRILPGVRIGDVDLSGLSAADASDRLRAAYAGLGQGSIVLGSPVGDLTIDYAEIGRRPDVDAMVSAALAVGRSGSLVERAVGEAQTALRGVAIEPRVTVDGNALSSQVSSLVQRVQRPARDASVQLTKGGFLISPSQTGRSVDDSTFSQQLLTTLAAVDAPSTVRLDLPVSTIDPSVTDQEAFAAQAAAAQMAANLLVTSGAEHWTISAATIRTWLAFAATADGGYAPTLDATKLRGSLTSLAKSTNRSAKDASFLTGKSGAIVGVVAGHNGRKLDIQATAASVGQALAARGGGSSVPSIAATFTTTTPKFTTDQAQKSAPLMRKISTWTTYFPVWSHNAFGANIWIPTLAINGTVVGPGETFDFWNAVGTVSRSKGYGLGGAIINGHTDPQGALGGGICSCSTTLFNAALRAGFEMHARKNHFYYISRYPLGLDATVFISAGGSKQTMSWRNDTAYPVLIRGFKIRNGNRGYVRFDLYSVPNGRRVVIGAPIVKNVIPASDSIQYTASLPKGATQRLEFPSDGMDVWRTVTVYQGGQVLRRTTYYSHYARITGVLLVGTGGSTSSGSSASPSP